jgi:predicted DNA-binding protein YlxM (UPF0122 family)
MEELEKSIYISALFDLYGKLLSSSQYKMIELYYSMDLSLSEIASQENISRNAVYDALKKGVAALNDYESKLELYKKREEFESKLERIKDVLSNEDYQKLLNIIKED